MKRFVAVLVACILLSGLSTSGVMAQKKSPEDAFAKMDRNADKKVSLEEFIGKKSGDKAEKAKTAFKKLDSDNDGFLTLDEFKGARKGKRRGK